MPIKLEDALNHHPLELTRQADPSVKMIEGEYTLDQLRARYDFGNGSEAEVLAAAAEAGQAFFKRGDDIYVAFAPKLGDGEEEIADTIGGAIGASAQEDPEGEDGGADEIDEHEVANNFDDEEDPEDAEIEVDGETEEYEGVTDSSTATGLDIPDDVIF